MDLLNQTSQVPQDSPVFSGVGAGCSPDAALIAASVHLFFNGRARVVAAMEAELEHVRPLIAAVVHATFSGRARIVRFESIQPDLSWAREGRRDIFTSRRAR